jgi:hypothetical protein
MWMFQQVEVFGHIDKAKVNNWFIKEDSELKALAHIAARNKFKSTDNSSELVDFLYLYYDQIVRAIADDDPVISKLENQNGLNFWRQPSILQTIAEDPEVGLDKLVKLGVRVGVLTKEILMRFITKPYQGTVYRFIEIEFDPTPF